MNEFKTVCHIFDTTGQIKSFSVPIIDMLGKFVLRTSWLKVGLMSLF